MEAEVTQRRPDSRLAAVLWIVGATVLGWPTHSFVAERGLDPSWRVGATFAHVQDLRYGDDIIFNYGPLGFITSPLIGGGIWFVFGIIGMAALVTTFAALTFAAARLHGASVTTAGVATSALLLVTPTEAPLIEFVVLSVAGLIGLGVWHRRIGGPLVWACAGVVAATLMLVKVSAGPVIMFVVVCACVADSAPARSVLAALAGFCASLIGWWLVLGQHLTDLVPWLRGAVSVAAGHTAAMAIGESGALWQYGSLVVVVVTGMVLVLPSVRRLAATPDEDLDEVLDPDRVGDRLRVGACVVMLVAVGWFFTKQGFVRRDGHVRVFFLAATWCGAVHLAARPAASTWQHKRREVGATAMAVAVSLVCALIASTGAYLANLNPLRPAGAAVDTAAMVLISSHRTEAAERAIDEARAVYGVPQTMLDRIGAAPVHIDPHEATLAWVYGLEWQPIPTLQRYLGYTGTLDEANAERLLDDDGPQFVLRTGDGHIDGRYGLAESPAYVDALLCNFDTVEVSAGWLLFERADDRCGPIETVAQHVVTAGDELVVPTVDADDTALYVGIDIDTSLLTRVAGAALKPPSSPTLTLDGEPFRLIEATSATPALIGVPLKSGWQAPMLPVGNQPRRTLSVDRSATITFFTRTVQP